MKEIPECLTKRYKAVDELMQELNTAMTNEVSRDNAALSDDPGIKLMCQFWNILKEDPDLNLTQEVQERMNRNVQRSKFQPRVACYMAGCCKEDPPPKKSCSHSTNSEDSPGPCGTKGDLPLNKALCGIKEATSFDTKCSDKAEELLVTQKQLQEQIYQLESKEKKGVGLLKEADSMWTCMEDCYKKKVVESIHRQKELLKELRRINENNMKWRRNKKDLETQINDIAQCKREIAQKIQKKTNDAKCIQLEIESSIKKLQTLKKDIEASQYSISSKTQTSNKKIKAIEEEIANVNKILQERQTEKSDKEKEGNDCVREVRGDLKNLCSALLQKRLESDNLAAEKEVLLTELTSLKETYDQCKDKCKARDDFIESEIKRLDKEIGDFELKCIKCHVCTDTQDVRKYCTDCPHCTEHRKCNLDGDKCSIDHTQDCVCMSVKQKFLDNVLDNMNAVLERQSKSGAGTAVTEAVMQCLERSKNGKLDKETRKILQDFILTTVKKNLNLTIVGGAVKTRCEMDPETYKQLMICLKQVKTTKPAKSDKGTDSKRDPCNRWGGTSECNCPKGPKDCPCRHALPPPGPTSCLPPDAEDMADVQKCPHDPKVSCGADCAAHANAVGTDVSKWKPNPCQSPRGEFKNVRAAQCILGPESLSATMGTKMNYPFPDSPPISILTSQITCQCTNKPMIPCSCQKDVEIQKDRKLNKTCDQVSWSDNLPNDNTPKDNTRRSQYTRMKLKSNKQNFEKTLSCDAVPTLSKTSSGNMLKVVDNQINEIYDRQTNTKISLSRSNKQNLSTCKNTYKTQCEIVKRLLETVKNVHHINKAIKSSPGRLLGDFDGIIYKTSSGNIVIDIDDIQRQEKSLMESNSCQTSASEKVRVINSECQGVNSKTDFIPRDKYFKIKLKGPVCPFINSLVVFKSVDDANYELVFDKEFENILKDVIKELDGDDKDHIVHMYKGDYDQYVLDFERDENTDNFSEDVILVKSPSGRIVILSSEMLKTDSYDYARKRKSIIKPNSLVNILKELIPCKSCHSKTMTQNQKQCSSKNKGTSSRVVAFNLISKAQIKSETRLDCHNFQEILMSSKPPFIHESDSGNIEIILQKSFKVELGNKLKKYLKISSKPLETLKFAKSSIGSNLTTNNNNNEINMIQKAVSFEINKSLSNEDVFEQNGKSFTKKLTQPNSQTCRGYAHSYDSNKYVCKYLKYKKNNWIGVPERNDCIETIQTQSTDKEPSDIVIKPESIIRTNSSYLNQDCYRVDQVCPIHHKKNYDVTNAQGISGFYSTDRNATINKTYGCVSKFKSGDSFLQGPNMGTYWDYIEYLPPQLPPFLRDFTYD